MSAFDLLPDAVVHVDASFAVVELNSAATALLGERFVVGVNAAAMLDPRDKAGRHVWTRGWHGSSSLHTVRRITPQELTITGPGGDLRVNAAGTYLRDDAGALVGALVVLRPAPRRARSRPG